MKIMQGKKNTCLTIILFLLIQFVVHVYLGIETQFATNHVAHYYLTMQLLPLLIKSGPSRIVNVSSIGHMFTSAYVPKFDQVSEKKGYNATLQYGFTKVL